MNQNATKPALNAVKSFLATIILGLRVLFSEIKWLFLKAVGVFEQAQLKRRLRQEYAELGKSLAEQLHGISEKDTLPRPSQETLLAIMQIKFLTEEINHLELERDQMRKEFVEKRRQRLGLNKNDQDE